VLATFTPIHFSPFFGNFDHEVDFVLPTPYTLSASTTYWLVMGTDLSGGIFDAVYWGKTDSTPPSGIFTYVKDMEFYSGAWNPPFWGGYRKWALYGPAGYADPNPTSLLFGYQEVGTTSASQTVTVTNTGYVDMNVSNVSASGDFAVSGENCTVAPVAPAGTCSFEITFTPTAAGVRTGDATITSDASNSPTMVGLTGNGYVASAMIFVSDAATDGHATESGPAAGLGGSSSASGGYLQIGDLSRNRQVKGFLSFDTSSLPDDAVILGAHIELRYIGKAGDNPFTWAGDLNMDIASPFGTSALLTASDFQATASAFDVAACDSVAVLNWYTCDLVSGFDAFNRLGFTQFRLYFDLTNNADKRADYVKIASGNNPHVPYRPVLIVDYYVP
jgi:hypothetical protein